MRACQQKLKFRWFQHAHFSHDSFVLISFRSSLWITKLRPSVITAHDASVSSFWCKSREQVQLHTFNFFYCRLLGLCIHFKEVVSLQPNVPKPCFALFFFGHGHFVHIEHFIRQTCCQRLHYAREIIRAYDNCPRYYSNNCIAKGTVEMRHGCASRGVQICTHEHDIPSICWQTMQSTHCVSVRLATRHQILTKQASTYERFDCNGVYIFVAYRAATAGMETTCGASNKTTVIKTSPACLSRQMV